MSYKCLVVFLFVVSFCLCRAPQTEVCMAAEQQCRRAAKVGDVEKMGHFLTFMENINARSRKGHSVLSLAVAHGHTALVEMVLKHPDIHINAQDSNGNTALMAAVLFSTHHMVALLLSHQEIDLAIKNKKGETALSIAQQCSRNNPNDYDDAKKVELLLAANSSFSISNPRL